MTRIMKWLAAVVGGLGALAPVASAAGPVGPGAAWHNPGPFPPRVDYDYVVMVHHTFRGWTFHGKYETLHQARIAEQSLERLGYRVRVETVRDYHGPRRW
jgi:hypothetical protein